MTRILNWASNHQPSPPSLSSTVLIFDICIPLFNKFRLISCCYLFQEHFDVFIEASVTLPCRAQANNQPQPISNETLCGILRKVEIEIDSNCSCYKFAVVEASIIARGGREETATTTTQTHSFSFSCGLNHWWGHCSEKEESGLDLLDLKEKKP